MNHIKFSVGDAVVGRNDLVGSVHVDGKSYGFTLLPHEFDFMLRLMSALRGTDNPIMMAIDLHDVEQLLPGEQYTYESWVSRFMISTEDDDWEGPESVKELLSHIRPMVTPK